MEFKKDDIYVLLNKNKDESLDNFIKRGNFIINYNKKELFNNFENVIKQSKIYINKNVKKCKY